MVARLVKMVKMVNKVNKVDALVWFNGPSQTRWLDLPRFPLEIGCNFFADVRSVDHICCFDWRMKSLITQKPGITYWCRNGHRGPNWEEVTYPMNAAPENSGMMAIRLAMNLGCRSIRVLGCDWGVSDHSVFESRYPNPVPGRKYDNQSLYLLREWKRSVDITFVSDAQIDVPFLSGRLDYDV
jgi:hypothetical protein